MPLSWHPARRASLLLAAVLVPALGSSGSGQAATSREEDAARPSGAARRRTTAAAAGAEAAAAPAPAPAAAGYSGHGAMSLPPEVIEKFAPPPLAAELTARIQSMLDVRAPGLGVLAPDGTRLFFTWNVTGTNQAWRLDGPDRFPVQLTGGDLRTSVADVTRDGRFVIAQRDRRGEENPGLYLLPVEGGSARVIQHLPGVQTRYALESDDGRWIYFQSNDVKKDAYAVYRYEVATGKRETIHQADGLWSAADVRPDGTLLLRKSTGSLSSEWSLRDPTTGALTPLMGQGEAQEYDARFGARAGDILVRTPKLGEFRRLYRFKGGAFEPVTADIPWDVAELHIDRARKRIFYVVNEGGRKRLKALDASSLAEAKLPAFPEADHVYIGATTPDGRFATLGVETSRAPRTSYILDLETGKLVRWLLASAPEVDTSTWAEARLETYPAKDGTPIPMLVRRPAEPCAPGPCPVIVHFHGGPEGQSRPGFSPTAQLFVDQGFIWVDPNVRGSDGYGRTWLDADNGAKRLDVIGDIEDAARHIRTAWARDGVAPKIGIYGGSYGGYAALIGMSMFGGTYDAGVSVVGISNLESFLRNTAPYRRILRISEYGDPDKDQEALRKLSPTSYLDRVKSPLLLVQGLSDPRVPAGEAVQIHEALAARGVEAPLLLFADEGHGSAKRDNRALELGHVLRFFRRHLQEGGEVPPPRAAASER